MPRPRKPTALLELSGAFRKHPERKRPNEPKPTGPLGAPPSRLSPDDRVAWFELDAINPAGVLTNADRWLVELAARLMARLRQHGLGGENGLSAGQLAQLNRCLSQMGMTPADRSKVSVIVAREEPNPFTCLDDSGPDLQ